MPVTIAIPLPSLITLDNGVGWEGIRGAIKCKHKINDDWNCTYYHTK